MARVLVSWSHSLMKKLQGKRNASAHQLFRSAQHKALLQAQLSSHKGNDLVARKLAGMPTA